MRTSALTALGLAAMAVVALLAAADQPQMQKPWWDRAAQGTAPGFKVRSDLRPEGNSLIIRHLTNIQKEFAQLVPQPPRSLDPLEVYLFSERREFDETLRTRFGVNAEDATTFFRTPSGSGLAICLQSIPSRRYIVDLQHEAFHQFASVRFGSDLPMWADEGLAQLFGPSVRAAGTLMIRPANPRVLATIRDALEKNEHVPFARMLAMTPEQWAAEVQSGRGPLLDAQAWSMVHCLNFADADRNNVPDLLPKFQTYLALLQRAFPAAEGFIRAFGPDGAAAFEQLWRSHVVSLQPSGFAAAFERIEFLAEGALELRRRGDVPASLSELRDALRAMQFTWPLKHHGIAVTLAADSDAMFEIPSTTKAAFDVSKLDPARLPPREREVEKLLPSPPSIRTTNLTPMGLEITWMRIGDGTAFTYDITVK